MMPLSLLHLRILLFFLFFSTSYQQQTQLHPGDAAALSDIRRALRDLPGSKFFSSWNFSAGSATDPCSFAGVVCDNAGDGNAHYLRVSVLTLGTGLADSPGLTGSLPDSLNNLSELTDLVLYPGRVAGQIPSNFGYGLRRLRLVSLSGNLLTGPIPTSLAGLPELHTLDLGNNHLQGPIPPALLQPSSPSLKVLILANNGGLSGEIPSDFSASQLFHVDLSKNAITGTLPALPLTLRYLSVATNSMHDCLDAAFSGSSLLPDLGFLDLSMNAFSGPIPSAIFALPNLSSLLLDRNNFTGPICLPEFNSALLPPWSTIDLSYNAISGEVPAALATAGSLLLNNNRMSGMVPEAVAQSVFTGHMTTFYAQHNFLTGFPVPPLSLPDSTALCLSYNCMELPSAAAAAGCPTSGGPLQSRPSYQCRNNAATGDDNGGGDG